MKLITEFAGKMREMQHMAHGMHTLAENHEIFIGVMARNFDELGKKCVADVKSRFGNYTQMPWGTWPTLSDVTIFDKAAQGFTVPNPLVRTESLKDSYDYDVGEQLDWAYLNVGTPDVRGAYHELGFHNVMANASVPPRPILYPTALKYQDEAESILGEAMYIAISVTIADSLTGGYNLISNFGTKQTSIYG